MPRTDSDATVRVVQYAVVGTCQHYRRIVVAPCDRPTSLSGVLSACSRQNGHTQVCLLEHNSEAGAIYTARYSKDHLQI